MNDREWQFLSPTERSWRDASALPTSYLLKSIAIKLRRRLWGRFVDRHRRLVWTPYAITESDGPVLVARTYLEHAALREVLRGLALRRVCELGCGYGRMTMALQEFAPVVKAFEREPHLAAAARTMLPNVQVEQVADLALAQDPEPYDLVMTFTVLQHLTDVDARRVCDRMKELAPSGHVLIVEKTEDIDVTAQVTDGRQFLSRARSVAMYEGYLTPFRLVTTMPIPAPPRERAPGHYMLFSAT